MNTESHSVELRPWLRLLSGALVTAGLLVAGYWGHRTHWTFGLSACKPVETLGSSVLSPEGAYSSPPGWPTHIRCSDPASADVLGIDAKPAWIGPIEDRINVPGESHFDPARVSRVPTRAGGQIRFILKKPGEFARAGDCLAVVDSAEVGAAKTRYLRASVQRDLTATRLKLLRSGGTSVSETLVREAESAMRESDNSVEAAKQALINLGFVLDPNEPQQTLDQLADRIHRLGWPDSIARRPDAAALPSTLLPICAVSGGLIVNGDLAVGENVEPGATLFTVIDPSRIRLTLHVAVSETPKIRLGQAVRFLFDGMRDPVTAAVTVVGETADENSRTVPVTAETANDDGRILAHARGRGDIIVGNQRDALLVPVSAVFTIDGRSFVFVRDSTFFRPNGECRFELRWIEVGVRDEAQAEIVRGVNKGESVVTAGGRWLIDVVQRKRLEVPR